MDQQGQQPHIQYEQLGCTPGVVVQEPQNTSNFEVVQTSSGNFRIVTNNGQQYDVYNNHRAQMLQPQKHQSNAYVGTHPQSLAHVEPVQFNPELNFIQQQQLIGNNLGARVQGFQQARMVIDAQTGGKVLVLQATNPRDFLQLQQNRGVNVAATSPPGVGRSRGRTFPLDGAVGNAVHRETNAHHLMTPSKNLPLNVQVSPMKIQIIPATTQLSPPNRLQASPSNLPSQAPNVLNNNSPTHLRTPSPKSTPSATQNHSLGAQSPLSQVITSGNKCFNIISSTTCKAVPLRGSKNENESETSREPIHLHPVQALSPYQPKPLSSPKVPSILSSTATPPPPLRPPAPLLATPPQRPPAPLLVTPVSEEPKTDDDKPIFISGKVAVCKSCGYSSVDFNKCQRCRRKFPESVRCQDEGNKVVQSIDKKTIKIVVANSTKPASPRTMVYSPKSTFSLPLKSTIPLTPSSSSSSPKPKTTDQKTNARPTPTILKNKKPTPNRKPKRIEEPVCLTISDDEDDSTKEKPALPPPVNPTIQQQAVAVKDIEMSPSIKSKEPSLSEIQQPEEVEALTLGLTNVDLELFRKGMISNGTTANVKCRTVRVGSYKVEPLDTVLFCAKGVRISLPHPETKVGVVLEIPRNNICGVLAHLGRSMPVFFLYIKSATCARIRLLLNMKDSSKDPFFDPESTNETQKRITLLPDKISDESKLAIKKIFSKECGKDIMTTLESKEANIILVKASPVNADMILSTRQTRSQDTPRMAAAKELIVYPKPPLKGGIPITTDDYLCLGEEQFLNDVIIDFYLKYLLNKLSDEDQARTHIFSSFFYRRLTTKQLARKSDASSSEKLTPAEQRHARVKSWTKNVDIFEKDFVFIPINEHAHWFLAVICFPGIEGLVKMSDGQPISPESLKKQKSLAKQVPQQPVVTKTVQQFTIGATTLTFPNFANPQTLSLLKEKGAKTVISLDEDEGSDRDEAEGDEEEFKESGDEGESGDPLEPAKAESTLNAQIVDASISPTAIKQACILIFDSLPTNHRSRVVATLRDYLTIEYKAKKGSERIFNKDIIRGALPKVPQQNNFTDCGIFMLQYAESFFVNPIKDFNLPLKNMQDWFMEETVRGKREDIANLIQKLMAEDKVDVKLPEVTFPKPMPAKIEALQGVSLAAVQEPAASALEPVPSTLEPVAAVQEHAAEIQETITADLEPNVPEEMQVEGAGIVSLAVVVPEDHMLPPIQNNVNEVVISDDLIKETKSVLNDSVENNVDPENMNQCIELVNSLFGDDDMCSAETRLKRSAELPGDEISPKRSC